ncbi:hypothetical protein Y032_0063g3456 [Ancylostoma ceylanicum]|uniref:Uncharacterized protein n=1 Tax=Ancylostoma ceylanicum TaxID=53326 RepID=A0A016U0Y4_9BILA|nr:hypothetical protein Y032_0063g3456 [Ancylostoma ceylanicum]
MPTTRSGATTIHSAADAQQPDTSPDDSVKPLTPTSPRREITLCPDQSYAVRAGDQDCPLLAIQAAFGTGKTVVGALITARVAAATGSTVIATATTNTAVAHFTDTLLRLNGYHDLPIMHFVPDSALVEGAPRTSVDLDILLKRTVTDFADVLSPDNFDKC